MQKPTSVAEYLSWLTDEQRAALDRLRATIRSLVPDATEDIYYSMPAFRLRGKAVVSYAAFRDHYSLFPLGSSAIDAHLDLAKPYRTGKGTLQFPLGEPVPEELVSAIVRTRLEQIEAG
ncbi:MAG TPA: DUF1801 domain-containing protein [Candidatus Dormibacteraeota bacterium]|nr:DUF1801 domain-containing protein [Candidatus Dormibacteraeota bacterium]